MIFKERDNRGMKKLAFVGAGSHADAIRPFINSSKYELVGFFDDKQVNEHDGLPILGKTTDVIKSLENGNVDNLFITVGDNGKRAQWFNEIAKNYYDSLINIIAPSATIIDIESVQGRGIFIGAGAFVGRKVSIFDNTIINTHAVVEHHSIVEKHVNLTPNAVIAGFVHLKTGVYMGLSSSAIQLVTIPEWSIIGAGAVVIKNPESTGTYVGIPAKKLESNL